MNLPQEIEEYRNRMGASYWNKSVPRKIAYKWSNEIQSANLYSLGEEGAYRYLSGRNLNEKSLICFAVHAENSGQIEMANGFWKRAYLKSESSNKLSTNSTKQMPTLSIGGNVDGNIIVGDKNQITISSDTRTDRAASELAIKRLQEEINAIRNADNKVTEIKEEYQLKFSKGGSSLSNTMQLGLAYILVEFRKEKPSNLLKSLNGTGFTEKKLNSTLETLTIAEIKALKVFFPIFLSGFKDSHSPVIKDTVKLILEDLEKIIDLEEAKKFLPRKIEELKKHQKIVEII